MGVNQFDLSFTTDLSRGLTRTPLQMAFVEDDHHAHVFTIKTTNGGAENNLTGAEVRGYFISPLYDVTVELTGEVNAEGNAVVKLTRDCYAYVGRFFLVIKATIGEASSSIFYGDGAVLRSQTGQVVEPSGTVPSLSALEARINALDTAKAPAGYGLGELAGNLAVLDDCHNAYLNGWYRIRAATQNGLGVDAVMRADVLGYASITLTAYTNSLTAGHMSELKKVCVNGTWGEWEYVNPPMVLGVEYRTTERWNGKAVYTMCVSYGTAVNDASGALPDGAKNLIRHAGMIGSYSLPVGNIVSGSAYAHSFYSTSGAKKLVLYADPTVFGSGAYTWYENLWYTKD